MLTLEIFYKEKKETVENTSLSYLQGIVTGHIITLAKEIHWSKGNVSFMVTNKKGDILLEASFCNV